MEYQIVEREQDGYKKFCTTVNDTGDKYEIPCVLDADGDVDTDATKSKMAQHIIKSDELASYRGE